MAKTAGKKGVAGKTTLAKAATPSPQIALATQKFASLVAADTSPPVIYRTAPDGSRQRCVWRQDIQDYDCEPLHADGMPIG
jgi:hypothetical protein